MEYTVAGYSVLSSMRPTFSIPFFSRRGTNQTFAQEMNAAFEIVSFLPFETFHYDRLPILGPLITKREGEAGIIALVRVDNQVVVGTKAEMAEVIRTMNVDEAAPAFFAVEAAALLGGEELRAAQIRASRQFNDPDVGRRWLHREQSVSDSNHQISARARKPLPDPELLSAIGELRDDPTNPLWHRTWCEAWKRWCGNEELVELAQWWLDYPSHVRRGDGRVIAGLIRHAPTAKDFVEYAIRWLAERLHPLAIEWPSVWLSVAGRVGVISPVAEAGYAYLAQALQDEGYLVTAQGYPKGRKLASSWVSIWGRLWKGSRRDRRLHNLAREYLDRQHPVTTQFVESVLFPLLRNEETQLSAEEVLLEWIYNTRAITNLWAKVYLSLLRLRPYDQELIDCGLHFLSEGFPNLRTWPKVWKALSPHMMGEQEIWTTAEQWLLRAEARMSVWPDVLVDVLKHNLIQDEASLRGKVIQWLRLGLDHPEKALIEVFGDAKKRGAAGGQEAIAT